MNVYTPRRYDERVIHLALGIEPVDATGGGRSTGSVDVRSEEFSTPVADWRLWRPGETFTSALPRMRRHASGRFVRRFDTNTPATVTIRLVDDLIDGGTRIAGAGRGIVPRRLAVDLPTLEDVVDADTDPDADPIPIWRRAFSIGCHPGAGADLPSRATVLRGRIVRQVDGVDVPVRWARVRGTNPTGDVVGWAHGDDRGEFVLVVGAGVNDIGMPDNPLRVSITIGAEAPPPTPDPADPLRSVVDPLWDLPVETITVVENAADEPTVTGRGFLPQHTVASPISPPSPSPNPIDLPHGRETSAVFRIA